MKFKKFCKTKEKFNKQSFKMILSMVINDTHLRERLLLDYVCVFVCVYKRNIFLPVNI